MYKKLPVPEVKDSDPAPLAEAEVTFRCCVTDVFVTFRLCEVIILRIFQLMHG